MEQEAAYEQFREDLVAETLREISQNSVHAYLFYYGDAIETRVREALKTAGDLHANGFYGPSLVSSFTAIEVTIHYFMLAPLVQGMFLGGLRGHPWR